MRVSLCLILAACVPIKASSSTSSTTPSGESTAATGESMGQPASAPSDPGLPPTGQPNRHPPAGMATMIALQPPPSRGADGAFVLPGGALSTAQADCGPAHDHCLRGAYIVKSSDYGERGYKPVFIFDGKFYRWNGKDSGQDYGYLSAPANAQNLAHAKEAIVFMPHKSDTPALPHSEQEALVGGDWQEADIGEINAAAGTFSTPDKGFTYKFEQSRALLEWVHAK